jgi:hypothetical protein
LVVLVGVFSAGDVADADGVIAGGVSATGVGGASMISLAMRGGKLATSVDDRVGVGTKDNPHVTKP